MMSRAETQIVIVLAIIAVHFVFREALFERAKTRKNDLSFPPVFGLRIVFWIGVPLFLFAAYKVSGDIRSRFGWIYPVLYLGLASLVFFSYPGTITLDAKGIGFRRYMGLRMKRMKWQEVVSVVSSKHLRTISVYARDGNSIIHTQFNVDPSRFTTELRKHLPVSILEQ